MLGVLTLAVDANTVTYILIVTTTKGVIMSKTEIKLEFLGTSGINPFAPNNSSPRMVMDSSHITQIPSLLEPDDVMVKTGIEYELGKYINDVRAEHDYTVKGIVGKYQEYGINNPPVYTMLVEYEENGETWLDYIDVDTHRASHGFFGYQMKPTNEFNELTYNSSIPKGTVLSKTASLGDDGGYKYGLQCNVAFMTHPSCADDGYVVSESFVKRARFTSIIKTVINVTKDHVLINLYGEGEQFKFIPNIGEKVRADGLLCALRQRNDWFSVSDMNTLNLKHPDPTFDIPFYVNTDSTVLDINVIKGNYGRSEFSSKMTEQLDHYSEMLTNYYRKIDGMFENIMNEKRVMYGSKTTVRLTPRLHRFITDCKIKVNIANTGKNKLCYRKLPIDQYRIEITTMSVLTPNYGYKLTDIHAAKGVICRILPDDHMPVDENGVRADIITDSPSTTSRMNLGRAYHAYLGAAGRDYRLRLLSYFDGKYPNKLYKHGVEQEDLYYFKNHIRGFYSLINPEMVEFIEALNETELFEHLLSVLEKLPTIYYPPDNQFNIVDVVENIDASEYAPHLGKVTYIDEYGQRVTTEDKVRIGNSYFIMLEKTAADYSAVSSAKVNNFGFPVKGTNLDKKRYPHSQTPGKFTGETETRLFASFGEKEALADIYDLALNSTTHKAAVRAILESDKAFDTEFDIDREKIPYGQTKSLMILRHMYNAFGFDISFQPPENGTKN